MLIPILTTSWATAAPAPSTMRPATARRARKRNRSIAVLPAMDAAAPARAGEPCGPQYVPNAVDGQELDQPGCGRLLQRVKLDSAPRLGSTGEADYGPPPRRG